MRVSSPAACAERAYASARRSGGRRGINTAGRPVGLRGWMALRERKGGVGTEWGSVRGGG